MKFLQAIELFGFAIGIVLQLSLFVLIRRYRRIEKLEILFLSLIASLFLWNTCRFLSLVFEITKFSPLNAILLSLGVRPALLLRSGFASVAVASYSFSLSATFQAAAVLTTASFLGVCRLSATGRLPPALADFYETHEPASRFSPPLLMLNPLPVGLFSP